MAQHWEESTINIEHIGQQNLQQGETVESSDNILYRTASPNNKDYADVIKELANGRVTFDETDPNFDIKALAEAVEKNMGRARFNEDVKARMLGKHKNDHSKQIEGAAEVFGLKSAGGQPTARRIQYEKIREASLESMRKNGVYQFCMLLAGFNNTKMSKYWITPSESELQSRAHRARETARPFDDNDEEFHRWYTETAWADGMIHLSPSIYAHLEEAYMMVTKKWRHLQDVPMNLFIVSPDVRSYFARIVSWNMRTSDVLSGQRYHLNSTYRRINMEKAKLLNLFRHVHQEGTELRYKRIESADQYVPGTRHQQSVNTYLDNMASINSTQQMRPSYSDFRAMGGTNITEEDYYKNGGMNQTTVATMLAYVDKQKQLIESMNNSR